MLMSMRVLVLATAFTVGASVPCRAAPIGAIEAATSLAVRGWAIDPTDHGHAVAVKVQVLSAGGVLSVVEGTAGLDRPDLRPLFAPDAPATDPFPHGLVLSLPASATSGEALVELLGRDDATGTWLPLAVARLPAPALTVVSTLGPITVQAIRTTAGTGTDLLSLTVTIQSYESAQAAYRIEIWGQPVDPPAAGWAGRSCPCRQTNSCQPRSACTDTLAGDIDLLSAQNNSIREIIDATGRVLIAVYAVSEVDDAAEDLLGAAEVIPGP